MVRGTSRHEEGLAPIEAAGIEPALADPDRVGTVLEHLDGVAVVVWLMGSATGTPEQIADLNTHRLERMLEKLVDSPVRGFVFEAAGSAPGEILASGRALVEEAAQRWRIPARMIEAPPEPIEPWLGEARAAATGLLGA